jgi:hypothetical protein
MKKNLIAVIILAAIVAVVFVLLLRKPKVEVKPEVTKFPEPPPGAIVFDMQYRGLSGKPDELRYNSYYGFGQNPTDTPFVADVKKSVKGVEAVYNPNFKGAEWSTVEIKDNKAVALYFDLNADGKLSDNEKILPVQNSESMPDNRTEFVTPDFVMTSREGRQVPFRALLQVSFYGQQSRPNFMWSPSCVLEGTSAINGKPTKLILFANGFSGSFEEFGRSSFSLQPGKQETGSYVSRQILSSIVNYEGQFYDLGFNGHYGKNSKVRAILTKYTGATGRLAVALSSDKVLKSEMSSLYVSGGKDNTINFGIPGDQSTIPVGGYKLDRAYVSYGVKDNKEWNSSFTDGPEFTISADQTCELKPGKPELSVSAVDESKRYQSDVKEQTTYAEGASIYFSRKITGKSGEIYGRFSQKQENSGYTDIEPEIKIVDSEGKQVANAKMKYG